MARPKGSRNKATAPFRERLQAYVDEIGADPFKYMADVIADSTLTHDLRLHAANSLAKYVQPQLKASDIVLSGNPDAPLVVRVRRRGDK